MLNSVDNKVKIFDYPENVDQKIVYLARVSNPSNQDNPNYEGLINFLIREKHWSCFDMCNLTFEVNTEKDVGIQMLRHPILPQEWSQRYADCSDMKAELRECRLQDDGDRQNSLVCDDLDLIEWWYDVQKQVQDFCFDKYSESIDKKIAKELCRSLLPLGLTSTKMYFNATVRQWLFYCLSRTHKSTQKEHRVVAKEILSQLSVVAPCTVKAFMSTYMINGEYDLDGLSL